MWHDKKNKKIFVFPWLLKDQANTYKEKNSAIKITVELKSHIKFKTSNRSPKLTHRHILHLKLSGCSLWPLFILIAYRVSDYFILVDFIPSNNHTTLQIIIKMIQTLKMLFYCYYTKKTDSLKSTSLPNIPSIKLTSNEINFPWVMIS